MKLHEYIKSLIKIDSLDSSKSFALVLSVIIGSLIGLCVCFCLIWDVCGNGYIKTDLDSLGIFLLCVGGFMAGGGINKELSERKVTLKRDKNGSNRTTEAASQTNDAEIEQHKERGYCR